MALRIPEGDRPLLEDIDVKKASGLNDMVQLMENLWDKNVVKRKTFKGLHTSDDAGAVVFESESLHATVV